MKKSYNRGFVLSVLGLVVAGALVINGCPMPMDTALLKDVKQRVDEYSQEAQPDIMVLENGVEILDGGSTDAFADAVQDVPLDVEFTIRNSGGADLHLRDIDPVVFSGTNAGLFSVHSPPGNLEIASGADTTFTVRFELDAPGAKAAELAVYSDDADENPYAFTVSNTALPEIQVLQGGSEIASGSGSYDFGTIEYGAHKDVEFTILNLGKWNLELTGAGPVDVSGAGFSAQSQPASPVAPGGSTSFTLRLEPAAPGACTGGVSIANSDSNENPYTFTLSGTCELSVAEVIIAAGQNHTAALKNDGTAWAWGSNGQGQLGNGSELDSTNPVQVSGLSQVSAIAAGFTHTVALKNDGTAWAWGSNGTGQLGDNSTTDRSTPVQVTGITDIAAITAGAAHTAALKNDGTVWAWGRNDSGQLGDGTTLHRYTPVQVTDLTGVIAVSAGGYHTAALKGDGTVWTWGKNDYGQLGNDTTTQSSTPVPVSGLSEIVAICAGDYYTAALKGDGTVWAWGINNHGQLGDNTTTDRSSPVQVYNLSDVAAISADSAHTTALKSNGTVWAWGYNSTGQLGDGTTTQSLIPVQVKGPDGVGMLSEVSAITAGYSFTVALKTDGILMAWGRNVSGQLGIGSTDNCSTPAQVSILSGVAVTAAGLDYSFGVKNNGTVWAWGDNGYGQLGDGTTITRHTPVQISGITGVAGLTGSFRHTVALKSDATVWAWGRNTYGQLGDDTTTDRSSPVQVKGQDGDGVLSGVSAIAAGNSHSVALKTDNTVWTWGWNYYCQLGDGTTDNSDTPVQVSGLSSVKAISGGGEHTVALKTDDTVWAWGYNSSGQLGDGTTTDRSSPVQVKGKDGDGVLSGVSAIGAGGYYTVALKSDNTVWAWGENYDGQLGDGTTSDSSTPVQVKGKDGIGVLSGVSALSAGWCHTVALKSDGTVWAWGDNSAGQLGNGTTSTSTTPVQVSGLSEIVAISAGGFYTVALKSDNTVWAWGENSYGQLGDGTTVQRHTPVLSGGPFRLW